MTLDIFEKSGTITKYRRNPFFWGRISGANQYHVHLDALLLCTAQYSGDFNESGESGPEIWGDLLGRPARPFAG